MWNIETLYCTTQPILKAVHNALIPLSKLCCFQLGQGLKNCYSTSDESTKQTTAETYR